MLLDTLCVQVQKRAGQPTGPADSFALKAALYVRFADNPGSVPDPRPDMKDPDDTNNPSNRPGRHDPDCLALHTCNEDVGCAAYMICMRGS